MSAHKMAQFKKIEDVLGLTLTLHRFTTQESVFGTSVYLSAVINDTEEPVIITTGSKAILSQLSSVGDGEELDNMQVVINARGKSYQIDEVS